MTSRGDTRRTGRPQVLLATCAALPGLEVDDQPLVAALAERGVSATPAVWDDASVDWSAGLCVLRSTWDYPPRRTEFLSWAESVPRLANPAAVVTWNTDKRYLADLARGGVRVVDTAFVDPGQRYRLPDDLPDGLRDGIAESGEVVLKPTVGAGSLDAGRYRLDDPALRGAARDHLDRLLGAGRGVMIQPYLRDVDVAGETALVFVEGAFSHAARKGAMLDGPAGVVDGLFREEQITATRPDPAAVSLAQEALRVAAVASGHDGPLLYGRVDVVPDRRGEPVVLEVELTEPSLFLSHGPGAVDRLADAVAARALADR